MSSSASNSPTPSPNHPIFPKSDINPKATLLHSAHRTLLHISAGEIDGREGGMADRGGGEKGEGEMEGKRRDGLPRQATKTFGQI